jgi:hypothetical protein
MVSNPVPPCAVAVAESGPVPFSTLTNISNAVFEKISKLIVLSDDKSILLFCIRSSAPCHGCPALDETSSNAPDTTEALPKPSKPASPDTVPSKSSKLVCCEYPKDTVKRINNKVIFFII